MTTTENTSVEGTYLFSKYTLRNERYTFGGDTLVQGDRAYGLYDPFEITEQVHDKYAGGKVIYRAWDVYEGPDGKRFSVETYKEDCWVNSRGFGAPSSRRSMTPTRSWCRSATRTSTTSNSSASTSRMPSEWTAWRAES